MKKSVSQNLIVQGKPQIITRPPVVVLLGHVDHGKTALLDVITNQVFTKQEFGQITQNIRVWQADTQFGKITFIDTPGHAYFTNLRGGGVKFADVGLLVISAVEGVKDQTLESIKLIKAAQIPVICAISKIDLPNANTKKVTKQLAEAGILVEGEGGQVPVVEISSLQKTGIEELIETISIVASLEELEADLSKPATGIVLESYLDRKVGPVALALNKNGVMETGKNVTVNGVSGKIRAIFDQVGKSIEKALPSQPIRILGLESLVPAGSEVRQVANLETVDVLKTPIKKVGLGERELAKQQLAIILKADSLGTKEAVLANLPENVTVVDAGVGQVTSSDVEKAIAVNGKILGFNVGLTSDTAKLLAGRESMFISSKLIYELIDQVKRAVDEFKKEKEEILGLAKILKTFDIDGTKIAGCKVVEGYLKTGGKTKIVRGQQEVGNAEITSLKQLAKSVEKVVANSECGVGFATPVDFQAGDVLKLVS